MMRRTLLATLFALVAFMSAPAAWAGSYLDRAAILLDESRKEGDMLQPRTFDKELATVIKALAEVRSRTGQKMEVPAAIAKAHPHLLLVLSNCERAADAALEGNFKKFMEHLNTAREEDKTFRALVQELGYAVPDLNAKK